MVGQIGKIAPAVGLAGMEVTLTPAEPSALVKDEGEAKMGSTSAADDPESAPLRVEAVTVAAASSPKKMFAVMRTLDAASTPTATVDRGTAAATAITCAMAASLLSS